MYKQIKDVSNFKSLFGTFSGVSKRVFDIPAAFIIGTTILTFLTYWISYFFRNTSNPMLFGNAISMSISAVFIVICLLDKERRLSILHLPSKFKIGYFVKNYKLEFLLITISAIIFTFLDFRTFKIVDNELRLGVSVFSDFGPHVSIIRSFSMGHNFPTQYPHFPDGSIRYHFMFQFLAGNLEYLGIRLDYAFNLISILSLLAMVLLLYLLTSIITGKKIAGLICSVLFFFRSSFAFFYYMPDVDPSREDSFLGFITSIFKTKKFIGKTLHEDWGLFAQNVYANQRHLAFGISSMLILLILFYPLYTKMVDKLPKFFSFKSHFKSNGSYFRELIYNKDAWSINSYSRCIFTGIFLGLCGFFNGAVLLSSVLILFFIAFFSKHRIEHIITAVLALGIFLFQVSFFAGSGNSELTVKIGFLAEIPSNISYSMHRLFNEEHKYFEGFLYSFKALPYIFDYYFKLLGILPFVLIASLVFVPRGARWLAFAFSVPILMATTLQFTTDLAVNHKYIMIAAILINIFVSLLIVKLYKTRGLRLIATMLILTLTITGVVDIISYYNLNKQFITHKLDSPFYKWVQSETDKNDVFFTHYHTLNPPLIAGRPIFFGWPYFAWSAGYNTDERFKIVKDICSSNNLDSLKAKLKMNNISYIYIDNELTTSAEYGFNRNFFVKNFQTVFEDKVTNVIVLKVKDN